MADVNTARLPISALTGDAVVESPPQASLRAIAALLVDADISAVVITKDGAPHAVVSERDLVHAVAAGQDPDTVMASDVANTDLVWCDAETTVGDVAELMMERWVRHVLVGRDGELAGIVSARDLLGLVADTATDA
jgi:CBS domain-containing protein